MARLAESTRAARRGHLIRAAVACFARAGYHATTMADIAAEAGVAKGTPYLYFPGKEKLFVALHEEWDCGMTARIDAAVAALPEAERRSPRAVLRAAGSAVGAYVVDQPATCRVLMEARTLAAYHPAIADVVRSADEQAQRRLEQLFRAGGAAGEWPADTDPALAARLFTATLDGLVARWHLAPGSFSWDAAVHALTGPAHVRP